MNKILCSALVLTITSISSLFGMSEKAILDRRELSKEDHKNFHNSPYLDPRIYGTNPNDLCAHKNPLRYSYVKHSTDSSTTSYETPKHVPHWEIAKKKRIEEQERVKNESAEKLNRECRKVLHTFTNLNKKLETIQGDFRTRMFQKKQSNQVVLLSNIKLPLKNSLEDEFRNQDLQHFVHLTEITTNLNGASICPLKLIVLIKDSCKYYNSHPDIEDYSIHFSPLHIRPSTILSIILKNHHKVIDCIKKEGLI